MQVARRSCAFVLACVFGGAACGAESTVTVRLGEQDSCGITGAASLTYDAKAGGSRIRFDVAKLPAGVRVHKALLRFWVDGTGPAGRTWGFDRWRDRRFDGFKVWRGASASPDKLLDTRYPFNVPTWWCFELDVTPAVRDWLAPGGENDGLCTNFQFPVGLRGGAEAAWHRPFRQGTPARPRPNRPPQPEGVTASCRSGRSLIRRIGCIATRSRSGPRTSIAPSCSARCTGSAN